VHVLGIIALSHPFNLVGKIFNARDKALSPELAQGLVTGWHGTTLPGVKQTIPVRSAMERFDLR
jgi:hypothetical protein